MRPQYALVHCTHTNYVHMLLGTKVGTQFSRNQDRRAKPTCVLCLLCVYCAQDASVVFAVVQVWAACVCVVCCARDE